MNRTHVVVALLGCALGVGATFVLRTTPDLAPAPDGGRESSQEPTLTGGASSERVDYYSDSTIDPDVAIAELDAAFRVPEKAALAWLHALDARRFAWIDEPSAVRALDLSRLSLDAEDLKYLGAFQHLRKLDLRGTGLGDDALAHLAALEHLVDLDLTGTLVSNAGLDALTKLEGLARLSLSGTKISDEGMATLAGLARLTDLSLEHTKVTGKALELLKELPLRALAIGATAIDDEGLVHLDAWKLKHLSLYRNGGITDQGLQSLRGQTELESLMMRGLKVGEKGLAHLADLKKLKQLNASLVMNDAALVHLRDLHALERLGLYSCPDISDAGIAHLEGLKNLRFLQLQFTHTGDEGLAHLEGLERLRFLDLRGTHVSPEAHAAWVKAHPRCRVLR